MDQIGEFEDYIKKRLEEIEKKRTAEIEAAIQRANAKAKKARKEVDDLVDTMHDGVDRLFETLFGKKPPKRPKSNFAESLDILDIFGFSETSESSEKKIFPTEKWIAEIINETNEKTITQPMIYNALCEIHPEIKSRPIGSVKGQIAAILKKMETKGHLIIHKKSFGQHPAEYRKRIVSKGVPITIAVSDKLTENKSSK